MCVYIYIYVCLYTSPLTLAFKYVEVKLSKTHKPTSSQARKATSQHKAAQGNTRWHKAAQALTSLHMSLQAETSPKPYEAPRGSKEPQLQLPVRSL